jgi:OOP family OmpA-OmpF porin
VKSWLALAKSLGVMGVLCTALLGAKSASGQSLSKGFAVNRYEPSSAGEWSFWVDHPWYSSTRYFAAGITLNYAHNPLVFGSVGSDGSFSPQISVIQHQFLGHVDVAGSFLDRVQINASLPITFLERGTRAAGAEPANGVAMGDPRLGLWVRLFGQPLRSAVSLSLGAQVWVPLRSFGLTSGVALSSSDEGVLRVLPKLALGGFAKHILWSFTAGFQYRPAAQIGSGVDLAGSTVGSELQLGAAIAYADMQRRFAIGPEAVLATQVLGDNSPKPFYRDFTSLEILLGAHYNIAHTVNVGVAGGIGLLRQPGTPDGRVLLRIGYAPMKEEKKPILDRDHDGILDKDDACPDDVGIATNNPNTHGCPDRDRDGVIDRLDICPDTPKGERPDPDAKRLGCPAGDRDKDGVLDPDDLCIDVPKGDKPDPTKLGCPAGDKDKDGVLDPDDLCVDVPKGDKPDPAKNGCPAGDRDKDLVVDHEDACPDQAGAPDPDPKKNGCPGTTVITGGQIKIIEPVFFATNKDVILKRSFPVLEAVANSLKGAPSIKKVQVEGHTDNRGKPDYNRALSSRRAASVVRFLVEKGIDQNRLQSAGFGPDKPIADNKSAKGREQNRRVDFVIIDPPQAQDVQVKKASEVAVPVSEDQSDKSDSKKGKKGKKGKKDKKDDAAVKDAAGKSDAADDGGKKKKSKRSRSKKDKAA